MKKIYTILLSTLLALVISGCGESENSYDGVTGLRAPDELVKKVSGADVYISDIYKSIIQADSQALSTQAKTMQTAVQTLNETNTSAALSNAREEFKELVYAYKRVEALYVAGYFSNNMLEIAEFNIEQYIKGSKSQDTAGDLDAVFAGNKSIVANSLKGITALEYTLFGNTETLEAVHTKMNQNRLEAAQLMADNLVTQVKKIEDFYQSNSEFTDSSDDGISALLNVLVSSSYSLRESRIGDAAGYTAKYKNNPDNRRLEYYKSTNSLEAIKVILQTHQNLMQNGLNDIAIAGNATSEADAISVAIEEALTICNSYNASLESELESAKTLELYETIRTLQNNYTAMIAGLNFTQKLLEADGD